ncbi:hypothetical protein FGO68_gene14423 [Halteria grandinella]|uniref:Protein kinase domain-containing protein n=1 Tax=Halteria grandinella TaxID=5974 RepID=A0A8J8NXX6_HALGN|nr:hypothetical protein FGO68_gene14423 [Halteria grandinella]
MRVLGSEKLNWTELQELRDQQLKFVAQMCLGLAEIHDKDQIHRDFKPLNILLFKGSNDQFISKIGDFDSSRNFNSNAGSGPNSLYGTKEYMSPDMYRWKRNQNGDLIKKIPYTSAVDVWAFGVTLYQLYTGYMPFEFKNLISQSSEASVGFSDAHLNAPLSRRPSRCQQYSQDEHAKILITLSNDEISRAFFKCPTIPDAVPFAIRKLIEDCLEWDPDQRPSIFKILSKPFIYGIVHKITLKEQIYGPIIGYGIIMK